MHAAVRARRRQEGFPAAEVQDLLASISLIVAEALRTRPELEGLGQQIHDNVVLSFQLAVDGVEDVYEVMEAKPGEQVDEGREGDAQAGTGDLEHMLHQLAEISDDTFPALLRTGP